AAQPARAQALDDRRGEIAFVLRLVSEAHDQRRQLSGGSERIGFHRGSPHGSSKSAPTIAARRARTRRRNHPKERRLARGWFYPRGSAPLVLRGESATLGRGSEQPMTKR